MVPQQLEVSRSNNSNRVRFKRKVPKKILKSASREQEIFRNVWQ